jgi:pimeloyl-ACP methyl ester carboxylesterase
MKSPAVVLRCSIAKLQITPACSLAHQGRRTTQKVDMNLMDSIQGLPSWLVVLLIVVAVLAMLAIINNIVARWAERRHPPKGAFMELDGTRLHYSDRGQGRPVVLLHGNAVTGADYNTSGVAERLVGRYRVIIFDRPGFGHSDRPRGRLWTAAEQADVIHAALQRLGVGPAVVVGHSWGTLVALALAERHPAGVAGLALLSGYYFPTPRLDALLVAPAAVPVLGDVLRHTVSPVFGWLTMPLMKRAMFAPAPMTDRFKREYSTALALRPSQLRATAGDGALMMPDAKILSARYGELSMPVAIVAGNGDKVVGPDHAERLRKALPHATLRTVEGAGHMVHHVATEQVVEAIEEVARKAEPAPADGAPPPQAAAEPVRGAA